MCAQNQLFGSISPCLCVLEIFGSPENTQNQFFASGNFRKFPKKIFESFENDCEGKNGSVFFRKCPNCFLEFPKMSASQICFWKISDVSNSVFRKFQKSLEGIFGSGYFRIYPKMFFRSSKNWH